jgi:DNA-directed RNA polymerase specialized sigma24 family protein
MRGVVGTGEWLENAEDTLDLRRKRDSGFSDRMVRRACWLEADDRELVLAMFERGHSAKAIGSMLGQPARVVRKRLRLLVARLSDPRVAYVVAHHNTWGRSRKLVARELFLNGHSMREVSQMLNLSLHTVRKHRNAIEAMTQASQTSQADSSVSRTWRRSEGTQP